jgi:hypothetical protein
MFIQKHHSFVYGSTDLASEYARRINRNFLSKIIALKTKIDHYEKVTDAISNGFENLIKRNYVPDLIIVPMGFSFRPDWIENNPDFIPEWQRKEMDQLINDAGTYKGILISRFFNKVLDGKAIICDFKSAFNLKLFQDNSFLKEVLSIELRPISKEEVEKKFSNDPDTYLIEENGLKITEEEAKIRIASTVILKFDVFCLFEVVDSDAFEIVSFSNKKE